MTLPPSPPWGPTPSGQEPGDGRRYGDDLYRTDGSTADGYPADSYRTDSYRADSYGTDSYGTDGTDRFGAQQGLPQGDRTAVPGGAQPTGALPMGAQPTQPWDPSYQHPYPAGYYPSYYYPGYHPLAMAPARKPRRGWRTGIAAAVVAAAVALGVAVGHGMTSDTNGSALAQSGLGGSSSSGSGGTSNGGSSNGSSGSLPGGNGSFPFPNSGSSSSGTTNRQEATQKQQAGVVDITTVIDYGTAAAAGTGMVLTSNGEILTNNHVIDGATSIKVRVVSTNKTYTATVVGTSPTNDIALLKLSGASGLTTANFGDSSTVKVGDSVTGVGNAGGVGGTPSAAAGKVTALNKTITASDESGANSETLNGVIVTDAPIQSGDSGGPLYNANDEVVGIDTAASTSGQAVGFSIPINKALAIIAEIRKGVETSSIHIGYPGFLGIQVEASQGNGALVAGVLRDGPADKAGMAAGDVITRVGSATITNATQLQKAISGHIPGSKISVTYVDSTNSGSTTHTVTVTLASGPAD